MKRVFAFVALILCALVTPANAADYYIDAVSGSDAAAGTAAAPWKTLDKINVDGSLVYGTGTAGNRVFLSGTFQGNAAGTVINKLKFRPVDNCTVAQWPGRAQAIIRGDIVPTWVDDGTGLFHTTLPDAPNTLGETDGMSDYVAAVVYKWDTNIDSLGRHYGHLQRAASAAAVTGGASGDYTYFYTPASKRLDVRVTTGDDSTKLAWCRGNVDGIEIGTPSYTSFPAHNSIQSAATLGSFSRPVYNFTLDGIWVYLWCDSGLGNRASTISIGYGIRVADGVNCTVRNCLTIDTGYHSMMFVGDCCYGNLIEDCVFYGGAPNTSSGNSHGTFYTGPGNGLFPSLSNVDKCIARRLTGYKYWHLDQVGVPMVLDSARASTTSSPTTCDGYICHTNNRGLTTGTGTSGGAGGDTATAANNRITNSASYSMYVGEQVCIVDSTATGLVAGNYYVLTAPSATTFTLSATAGGTEIDITADGACHWYSLSNRVLDALFEDCKIIESGKISDNTMCYGTAFGSGSRAVPPADEKDWRTYPVRYVRCSVTNGSRNLVSSSEQASFYQCSFNMPRAGIGRFVASTLSGVMGCISADSVIKTRQNYTACEITANLASSTENRVLFQIAADHRLFLINSSVYDIAFGRGVSANNIDSIFGGPGSTTPYLYVNNSMIGFRDNRASNKQFIAYGLPQNWITAGTLNCFVSHTSFVNVSTDSTVAYDSGTNRTTKSHWLANVDVNGSFLDDTSTATNNPFLDPTGGNLALTTQGQNYKGYAVPAAPFGVNRRANTNSRGAWQYGPDWWKYLTPARNRNN